VTCCATVIEAWCVARGEAKSLACNDEMKCEIAQYVILQQQ